MSETLVKENIFGTEKIGKLLFKFSLPSVISMLVNSIYNLVDQIFIGHGVGYLGNAATNVAFPYVTLALAVSLMVAAGTAANVSFNLGRKDKDLADKCFAHGIMLSVIFGFTVCILGEIFLEPLLIFFGSTENVLPYAMDFSRIILLGVPFMCTGIAINDLIRADGSPRYAMASMLTGAAINIILNPIFIFVCHWGVEGSALATIIGQLVSLIMSVLYISRAKTITFKFTNLHLQFKIIKMIISIGISAFITQLSMLAVQIVLNNAATKYGALSIYGADIPLTCFGIIMKINQIMMGVIVGITSSTLPIFGYNYGAKHYERVKSFVFLTLGVTTVIGIVGEIFLQIFPVQIISIFGQESSLYNEFAVLCLKNMTLLIFVMGTQLMSTVYYQAVGKPVKAIVLSISKQILFLIPCLLIMPEFFGIKGVMYAFPTSDAVSCVLAIGMMIFEIKALNKNIGLQKAEKAPA